MRPLTRWSVIVAVVLMGAALLTTAWSTYSGIRDASDTLLRGQADVLEHAARTELGSTPTSEDLAGFLDDHAAAGLRYVAVIDRDGQEVSAGESKIGVLERVNPVLLGRDMVVVDGRVRLQTPLLARRGWRGPGRPARVVLELEPVQVTQLQNGAARTFGIGALAASMLLGVAIVLFRWILRREAIERERAHERRLASLGEMSAVLAHEIKNPLASLKGNAQLLAEQLAPGEKPRQKADRVVAEAVRLEALTNNLLAFVRTGAIQRERIDPAVLLREAVQTVDPEAIEIDDAGAPPAWSLDAERMRQVLTNLLDNAVQAGAPVRAQVTQENGRLHFVVEDHGAGVAPEDRERIFEPFFTQRARGTGLGLAVAKRVVELHEGTIVVDAAAGGGARFRVAIPEA